MTKLEKIPDFDMKYLQKIVVSTGNWDKPREVYSGNFSLIKGKGMGKLISTEKSDTPIIATWGIGPCIMLSGYDTEQKIGFLVHYSDSAEICYTANSLVKEISKTTKNKPILQFYLVGGYSGMSNETLTDVERYLQENFNRPKISHKDVLGKLGPFDARSFALDTRNGKIYSLPHDKSVSEMGLIF